MFRSPVLIHTEKSERQLAATLKLPVVARRSFPLRPIVYMLLFAVATLGVVGSGDGAQVNSNIAGVNLAAIMRDSVSVSASPGVVNFALSANGIAPGSATVVVNTAWVLRRATTITTYGFFSSSTSALTNGSGKNIPSSSVSGSVNGGAFQTFTQACRFSANTCLQIFTQRVRRAQLRGVNNTNLKLQISTVGLALPPGTYTGVLHIEARAL